MSESASALFSIADAGEFRFARFYIVCEEVPLGTPESPPIVSGVSDMHPSDCPNVEETRNPMQTFSWKKCSHFSPTNIPSAFPHEIPKCVSNNITYQSRAQYAYCGNSMQARSHGTYPSAARKHAHPSLLHAHFCLREHYVTNRGFGSMHAKTCSQTRKMTE